MSDSGFPNIPSGARTLSEIAGRGDQAAQKGNVIALPADIKVEAQRQQTTLRLAGEIVNARPSDDGKSMEVRVRTPRGDVDIRVPRTQAPNVLREGRQVNIEITPERGGNESASIRPSRAETPQPAQQTRPAQSQGQNTAQNAQRQVNVEIPPEKLARAQLTEIARQTPSQAMPSAPPPAIPPGSTIRIEPLTIAQSAQITQPALEMLAAKVTQNLSAALTIIGANKPLPALNGSAGIPASPLQTQAPLASLPNTSVLQGPSAPLAALPAAPAPETVSGEPEQIRTSLPPLGKELLSPQNLQAPLSAQNFAAPFDLPPALQALQSTETALLPASAHINMKVENVLSPAVQMVEGPNALPPPASETQNQILENLRPGTLSATVSGLTDRGLPALSLELLPGALPQDFALQSTAPQNITQGTRLTIMPQTQAIGIQASATAITLQPAALLLPGAWPVMDEVLQTLTQHAPALAQAVTNIAPNAAGGAAQMTPAAMFFIAAIRSGDIGSWLGDKALEVLRREGKGNLLSRLGSEANALTRMGAEPVSSADWRGMTIPMMWQNEMQKIALYYKRDEGSGEEQESKGGNTRFLFDLNLSHMGKVQLDGLLRGTKLDLIVRTGQSFSQAMQQEMRRLYTGALEQAQMSGELSFTAKPESWVTINLKEKQQSVSI